MANFQSRTIFFSTSPRNPELIPKYLKLIREEKLENKTYNINLQTEFYKALSKANLADVSSGGNSNNADFSGREKLTRAPQALGFLIPRSRQPLKITEAGNLLMDEQMFEDIMIHQLLKFQLPSPLHKETKGNNKGMFNIKPFLEIIRLVYELEYLTYQELSLYGMTLTDFKDYEKTKNKIKKYRIKRDGIKGSSSLKKQYEEYRLDIFRKMFADVLNKKEFKVRESKETNEKKFLKTKMNNSRDYTDSVFRFLRSTGLFVLTKGKSISISPERMEEVKYILKHVNREIIDPTMPLKEYLQYLSNPKVPRLKNDNIDSISKEVESKGLKVKSNDLYEMKKALNNHRVEKREQKILEITNQLKKRNADDIDDIINTFHQITKKEVPNSPAVLEWNTWRAAVMINNGEVKGNFIPDDNGYPISTAGGSKGDVVGDYGDFNILYEVTLSSGKRQFDMEGEPVPRHIGELKKKSGKDTFGFFIAEKINPESIYHFYLTTGTNSKVYEGNISVIPMNLKDFIKFFKYSIKSNVQSDDLFEMHQHSINLSRTCIINGESEENWYNELIKYIFDKIN
ncbi:AlwI family type II restriction endonuclease [Staphylococcus simulans]|uniref:AlwI family type II restriction endonuclease n=1 Tax=Staphylococcus simulans TaxID=1286 RepID=UPI0027E9CF5A|nr:AlwI family type II restriction endonuclease [Staphylococcus simulans]MDQ7114135.1 AlwI family type II restriction endonuclease [Staphylococcus simulans]MDQ7140199.1 AlwI family type II restriction endonuclease [Staphylococcus simulans]WML98436.1 AlwI family type II restriction endonuclease [Staphylococcus simulans]WMM04851.1 AlwI family type II restriction endonuclease [Staphylococcus simulans]